MICSTAIFFCLLMKNIFPLFFHLVFLNLNWQLTDRVAQSLNPLRCSCESFSNTCLCFSEQHAFFLICLYQYYKFPQCDTFPTVDINNGLKKRSTSSHLILVTNDTTELIKQQLRSKNTGHRMSWRQVFISAHATWKMLRKWLI